MRKVKLRVMEIQKGRCVRRNELCCIKRKMSVKFNQDEAKDKAHIKSDLPVPAARCEPCSVCMDVVGSPPEFSASVLGTTSNASPNFLIAYWSSPCTSSA